MLHFVLEFIKECWIQVSVHAFHPDDKSISMQNFRVYVVVPFLCYITHNEFFSWSQSVQKLVIKFVKMKWNERVTICRGENELQNPAVLTYAAGEH